MHGAQVENRLQSVDDDDVARLHINPIVEHMNDVGRLVFRPHQPGHELRQVPPHFLLGDNL